MSVLKSKRNLSDMQFYATALKVRKDISYWLLRDFNTRKGIRTIQQVIKDITDEDKAIIDGVFEKYGQPARDTYTVGYPDWFVNFERERLLGYTATMMQEIMIANSIYAKQPFEWAERRRHQNEAIATCFLIYQEIQYIISLFPSDLNALGCLLDDLKIEISLLRGWRSSDQKRNKGTC